MAAAKRPTIRIPYSAVCGSFFITDTDCCRAIRFCRHDPKRSDCRWIFRVSEKIKAIPHKDEKILAGQALSGNVKAH